MQHDFDRTHNLTTTHETHASMYGSSCVGCVEARELMGVHAEQTELEPALQSKLEPVPEDTVFEPKPTLQNGLSDVEQTGALPKKRAREEARLFSKSKVGEWIAAGGGKAPEQTELDTTFQRAATPPVFELSGGQEKKRARTHRADEAIDMYKTRHKTDATAPPETSFI